MQPQTNGAEAARTHTHPARGAVESAFKNAGLTGDQAHNVMDALDEYVAAIAQPRRTQKKTPPKRGRSKRR